MQRYTLRQLEYLIACIDHGSIAQAAEALNVSQPSVSVAISKLEDQFGVQLLYRHHSQGVSPTPSAANILQSARSLLSHASDLERQAMLTGTSVAGELWLGSFATLAPVILPGLIGALDREYPEIRLRLREGTQEVLIDALRSGDIDLALLYDLDLPDDLRRLRLSEGAPYVALPEGHPLARSTAISLKDLSREPLILLDIPPSRDYFLGLFRSAGITPMIAHRSPSLEMVRGMVGHGLGYTILVTRPHGDRTYDGRALAIRPLEDSNEPSKIVLARLANLRATRLISCFERVAQAQMG